MTLRVENNAVNYLKDANFGRCKPYEFNENGHLSHDNMTRIETHGYNWDLYGDVGKERGNDFKDLKVWNYDDFKFEQIGEGFYGTVYKVTHCSGEVLVLKELKNAADEEHKRMFLEEIQLLNKLRHPNLLKFMGVAVHENSLCFLAEFIEGGSLEDLIENREPQLNSWTTRVNIALDVARGMTYLHSEGVMHRDLAAKNILIRKKTNGKLQAIVADLGLSYRVPDSFVGKEYELETVGSPFHMAPEVLNCKPYSIKADIFSYGIILCEIISGCPGADPDEIPRTEEFGLAIEEFSELVSDCPAEFLDLTVRCCQVNPKARPSFVDIVKVLDIILDKLEEKIDTGKLSLAPVQSRGRVLSMDYMIEPCVVCGCGKPIADLPNDDVLGIKMAEDRLGTLQRTASRQVLRKLVTRCRDCGGRMLVPHFDPTLPPTAEAGMNGTATTRNNRVDPPCEVTSDRDAVSIICTMEETESVSKAYQFTAGRLLHQDSDVIVAGTTHLAENTPGRLPKFFQYVLRTKKSRLRPKDGASGKRRLRKSLQDLFATTSPSGNYVHGHREEVDGRKSRNASVINSPRDEMPEEVVNGVHLLPPPERGSDLKKVDSTPLKCATELPPHGSTNTGREYSNSACSANELRSLNLDSPVSRRHSMPPTEFASKERSSTSEYTSPSEKSLKEPADIPGPIPFKKKRSRSIFSIFKRKKSDG